MEHHAFVFDHDAFDAELLPVLKYVLPLENVEPLVQFINTNLIHLSTPLEGTLLDDSWRESLPVHDVSGYGALALTRYYNPLDDVGLRLEWDSLCDVLG